MQTNYRTKFLTHSIKCVWMEHQEKEKEERENVVGCHVYTHSTPIIDLINIMLDLFSEKFVFWFLCFNILSNLTSIWFEPKQNGNSKRKKKFVNQFSFAWNFLYIYCFNAYECGKNINISGISSRLFGIKNFQLKNIWENWWVLFFYSFFELQIFKLNCWKTWYLMSASIIYPHIFFYMRSVNLEKYGPQFQSNLLYFFFRSLYKKFVLCVCGSGNWSWIGLYHRLESIQFCMIFWSKFPKDGACIRKSVAGCRNKGAKERKKYIYFSLWLHVCAVHFWYANK